MPIEDVVVKEGSVSDLPRIEALWQDFYAQLGGYGGLQLAPDGFSVWCRQMEMIARAFKTVVVLAEEPDREVVGFSFAYVRPVPQIFVTRSPISCTVADLFVVERYRSQALGVELLDAAFEWGRRQGAFRCDMNVMKENVRARKLYDLLGWREEHAFLVKDY